jgi:hypothetical protein
MLRQLLVIAIAVATLAAISWLSGSWMQSSGFSYFGPESMLPMLTILALKIMQHLLPGFIIGALLTSRPILTGAITSGVAAAAIHSYFTLHFGGAVFLTGTSVLVTAVEFAAYGLAGAALGRVALGSNNSFKADGSAAA